MVFDCLIVLIRKHPSNPLNFVENRQLHGVDLVGPLFDGNITCATTTIFLIQLQHLVHLIDAPLNCVIQNARDQQTFHLGRLDVQFVGDKWDCYFGVGPDEFDEHLGANVAQQVLDVLTNEGISHDVIAIVP